VFGLVDWARAGSLAEYAAVEARNLAPLPADVDHTVAAALPIAGLTAWQGLFDRSVDLVRAGGTLVTVAAPPRLRPKDGRALLFVVEPDRAGLAALAQRLRDGRLTPIIEAVRTLAEAPAAFAPGPRTTGKTIIRVMGDGYDAAR
jgi:NADPH:quinone reductase-like Zn-dependent oxidoreductase